MDRNTLSSGAHFHIQWDGFQRLDWQCFNTRETATMRAKELARPDEKFAIVEVRGTCPVSGRKAASGD
jgi:hypothetical protein